MTALERQALWADLEAIAIDGIQAIVDDSALRAFDYENAPRELGKRIVRTARRLADLDTLAETERTVAKAEIRKAAIIAHERRKRYGR